MNGAKNDNWPGTVVSMSPDESDRELGSNLSSQHGFGFIRGLRTSHVLSTQSEGELGLDTQNGDLALGFLCYVKPEPRRLRHQTPLGADDFHVNDDIFWFL